MRFSDTPAKEPHSARAPSPRPSSEPPLLPGKDQTSRECLDTRCSAVQVSLGRQTVPSSRHLWWPASLAAQWNPFQEGRRPSRCRGLVEAADRVQGSILGTLESQRPPITARRFRLITAGSQGWADRDPGGQSGCRHQLDMLGWGSWGHWGLHTAYEMQLRPA